MMGVNHMLIGATATSLLLGTASPTILAVSAAASLAPDMDISTSPAGRVLPWVSAYLEKRMPHRSCTHSFVATGVVAAISYGVAFFISDRWMQIAHALTIGYFFGWFADAFTRGGVEMFWPNSVRCACPGNRNLRLRTGSNAEYGILVVLLALALAVFNINNSGGLLTQFNRLLASPSGVQQVYNKDGATHLIKAHIKGVRSSDRLRVREDYTIILSHGTGFIVQSETGELYKASTEPDAQILIQEITADVGANAITNVETLILEDEELGDKLAAFNRAGTQAFVTGEISVDDAEGITIIPDPHQFPFMRKTQNTIKLEVAPIKYVITKIGSQFATGELSIRSITKNGGRE